MSEYAEHLEEDIKELQAENKKLRECLQKIDDRCDDPCSLYARQCLIELEEK